MSFQKEALEAAWGCVKEGDTELIKVLVARSSNEKVIPPSGVIELLDAQQLAQLAKIGTYFEVGTLARWAKDESFLMTCAKDKRDHVLVRLSQNPNLTDAHRGQLSKWLEANPDKKGLREVAYSLIKELDEEGCLRLFKANPEVVGLAVRYQEDGRNAVARLTSQFASVLRYAGEDDEGLVSLMNTCPELAERCVEAAGMQGDEAVLLLAKRAAALKERVGGRQVEAIGRAAQLSLQNKGIEFLAEAAIETKNPYLLTSALADTDVKGTLSGAVIKEALGGELLWLQACRDTAWRGVDADIALGLIEAGAYGWRSGPLTEEAAETFLESANINDLLTDGRNLLLERMLNCVDSKKARKIATLLGGEGDWKGHQLQFAMSKDVSRRTKALLALLEWPEELGPELVYTACVMGHASGLKAEGDALAMAVKWYLVMDRSRQAGGEVALKNGKLTPEQQTAVAMNVKSFLKKSADKNAKIETAKRAAVATLNWECLDDQEARLIMAEAALRVNIRLLGSVGRPEDAVRIAKLLIVETNASGVCQLIQKFWPGKERPPAELVDLITNTSEAFKRGGAVARRHIVARLVELLGEEGAANLPLALDLAENWAGSIVELAGVAGEVTSKAPAASADIAAEPAKEPAQETAAKEKSGWTIG